MDIIKMELRHLLQVSLLQEICFSDPWKINLLEQEMENPFALLAVGTKIQENKEVVLAFLGIRLIDEVADITTLGTHPDYRGQGLAKEMLTWLIDFLESINVKKIALEVRVSNAAAIGLYKSLGFIKTYEKVDYYSRPKENGFYMEKYLQEDDIIKICP